MNETGNSQTSSLKALSQNERTGPQHLIFLISKNISRKKNILRKWKGGSHRCAGMWPCDSTCLVNIKNDMIMRIEKYVCHSDQAVEELLDEGGAK
jgi:hypothetical protein